MYAEYKPHKLNEKCEKTGIFLGKHVITLYCTSISQVVKIKNVRELQPDTENDPTISDQRLT